MPAVETFKNIPELFEGTFEESIKVRTETLSTFKHLGPDDLVHVVKNIPNSRQHIKEVSSYHFVNGVDTSSSASIAAYINSLTYSLESQQKWFQPTATVGNSWNISKCTFCAFNAFEGTDVRVEARIPGGVKSFVVDVLGMRKGTDSDCWQETFISSILRTLRDCGCYPGANGSYDQLDLSERNLAKRSLDGLLTLQTEMKFLETASKLFYKGRQLGTPHGPHLAGNDDNYLTLGVVGYFCRTGRPEISIGFLKPFIEKDVSLKSLMMKCLNLASKQGYCGYCKRCLKFLPLDNQSLAVKLSSVECFDELSEFLMSRGEYLKAEHFASEALKRCPNNFDNWKRLIRIKIALKQPEKALIILNNSPMTTVSMNSDGDFYKNLPKPVLISLPGHKHVTEKDETFTPAQMILEKLKANGLKGTFRAAYDILIEIYRNVGWDALLECRSRVFIMEREYSGSSEDSKDDITGTKDTQLKSPVNEPTSLTLPNSNFLKETGKKLCERWLDNLILILFEDLRIFTLFSEELKQQASGHKNRSVKEWYLLANLSRRLGHFEEAKLAYQKCLFYSNNNSNSANNETFEYKRIVQSALNSLIKIYCQEGRSQLALLCTLRLIRSQEDSISHAAPLSHPSPVTISLCGLIEKCGMKRVLTELRSCQNSVEAHKENLAEFFKFLKNAKVHGYDM